MPYQVLYRTYRPSKFSEVVGQEYIVKTLLNAIKNDKIAHAYLFAGPRGTGKTTIAKLFAKAINCENFVDEACDECNNCKQYLSQNHPDIIEMDAASNNGVDDIREIVEQVSYSPLIGKYKVYIIDEVHMLSTSAFNALLKTLEEPPAHVIFILATTDPQKIIPTGLSRCQRYNFSKLTTFEIKKRIIEILKIENIPYDEKAVEQISRMAQGGMRDGLSLLEQCLAYNPKEVTLEDIQKIFGLTSTEKEVELFRNVHSKKVSEVITDLRKMYEQGLDIKALALDLLEIIKDTLIYSDKANDKLLNKINASEAQDILKNVSKRDLLSDAKKLEDVIGRERQNQNFLVYFELALIEMASDNSEPIVKQEKVVEEVKIAKPVTPLVEDKQEEVIEKEEVKQEKIDTNTEFLLSIVLDANKDLKINDQIIYNKLDLYQYEPEKRKFYQLLVGSEIFACNKDAIIICGNANQVEAINSKNINEELFKFINMEFGINKMVYAIDEDKKKQLIDLYKKAPAEKRNQPVVIEKYKIEIKEDNPQDKVVDLFGDMVKVQD